MTQEAPVYFCTKCGKISEVKDFDSKHDYYFMISDWLPRYDVDGNYIGYTKNSTGKIFPPEPGNCGISDYKLKRFSEVICVKRRGKRT